MTRLYTFAATCAVLFATIISTIAGCSSGGVLSAVVDRFDGPAVELIVWEESFVDQGSIGAVHLVREDSSTKTTVSIHVDDALNLKALYCTLEYNADRLTPLNVNMAPLLDDPSDLLELANYTVEGQVDIGQAIAGLSTAPGFNGSGLFAEVEFSQGHRPWVKNTSTAPTDDKSRATLYKNGSQLSWRNFCSGDYDQNGEVNISDLTPLGMHFGAVGPFDVSQALSCIDGDWNGELNIADITTIGVNYGRYVEGYNIYAGPGGAGYPTESAGPNGPEAALLGTIGFSEAASLTGERLLFAYTIANEQQGDDYWVRPYDGTSEGIASTLTQSTGPGDSLELVLTNAPTEGNGTTPGSAFIVDDQTNYSFEVVRNLNGTESTVTFDPNTEFIVSNSSAGSVNPATAILNITDGHEGLLAVQAAFNTGEKIYSNYVWLQIGSAGTFLALMLTNPPASGSGLSSDDPFICNDQTDYQFKVELIQGSSSTEVTIDALTAFTVSNSGVGEVNPSTGILNITDGYEGVFNVQAVYEYAGFLFSNLMWLQVGTGAPVTEAQRYVPLTTGMAYKYSVAKLENPASWDTAHLEGTDMIARTRFNPIGDGIWFRAIGWHEYDGDDLIEGPVIKGLSFTGITRNEYRDDGPFTYGQTASSINYVLPDPIPNIGDTWPILLSMDGYVDDVHFLDGEICDNLHRIEGECTLGAIEDVLTDSGWYIDCIRVDFDLSYQSPWTIINWASPIHSSDWTGSYWLCKDIGAVKFSAEATVLGWGVGSIDVELEQYDHETTFDLASAVQGGDGTYDDPYVLLPGQVYDLSVMHPLRGDIAGSPDVTFIAKDVYYSDTIPESSVAFVNGRMSVSADFAGQFLVNAKVGQIDSNPRLLFFICYDPSKYYETENNDNFSEADALPAIPFSSDQVLFSLGKGGGYYDGDNYDYFSFILDIPAFVTVTMTGDDCSFSLYDSSEDYVSHSEYVTYPEYWKKYELQDQGLYYLQCSGDYQYGDDYTLAIDYEYFSPVLSVNDPPDEGWGTESSPYLVETGTSWVMNLEYPGLGNVATDANTEYTIHGDNVGTLDKSDATLYIDDGYYGEFYITATYRGVQNTPQSTVYFEIKPAFEPPYGALIILPERTSITLGETVLMTVTSGGFPPSAPFQYMNGAAVTVNSGGSYTDGTLNVGEPGGSQTYPDGIWGLMSPTPTSFLLPWDDLLDPVSITSMPGYVYIGFNVTPIGGYELTEGGALFNFEMSFDSAGEYTLGFIAFQDIKRTYYSDYAGSEYDWLDISNDHEGLPRVITVHGP